MEIPDCKYNDSELYHYGILGMKWGRRRYQEKDGSLTPAGQKRYDKAMNKIQAKERELSNKRAYIEQKNAIKEAKKNYKIEKKEYKDYKNKQSLEKKAAKEAEKEKKKAEVSKNKSISEMTNEELLAYKQRLQIEKDIYNLKSEINKLNPPPEESGKKMVELVKDFTMKELWGDIAKPAIKKSIDKNFELEKTHDELSGLKKEADKWKQKENIARSQYNSWLDTYKKENKILSDNKNKDNNTNNQNKKKRRNEQIRHSDDLIGSMLISDNDFYHHGIKGQKWGIRRYQYVDGSLTTAGEKRYYKSDNSGSAQRFINLVNTKVTDLNNTAKTQITGKQYIDTVLKEGTTFSRIQISENFENYPFYATYKKKDMDKYLGLFGKNLISRSASDARRAEKNARATGSEDDLNVAKSLREQSDNVRIYQLKLDTVKKLKIPSDENAAHITNKLLKEPEFKKNVEASISDSREKMLRPTQQVLFKQAQNALKKDPSKLSNSEKVAIYKALNLSLVNHNPQEIAAQNRFYSELKKKGYNALLDYNDKEYSSYKAKRPMIIFDMDSVKLQSVTEANPRIVYKLYQKYNSERIVKEIGANTIGFVSKLGTKTVSECSSYLNRKLDEYLS